MTDSLELEIVLPHVRLDRSSQLLADFLGFQSLPVKSKETRFFVIFFNNGRRERVGRKTLLKVGELREGVLNTLRDKSPRQEGGGGGWGGRILETTGQQTAFIGGQK